MNRFAKAGAVCAALMFFGLAVLSLKNADKARALTEQEYMYLPNQTLLRHFTAGMNSIVANLLWLECIQYTGREIKGAQEYEWMERIVRTAAELDPNFVELYRYGGMFLASLKGDGDAAIDLLEQGARNNPEAWSLPYEIAMVYLLNRRDDPDAKCKARYYVAMSLGTGNAPEFMQEFYDGLKDQCENQLEDPCADLLFEAQTYQRLYETGEKVMQDVARQRMEVLQLRKACCDLMEIAGRYAQETGRFPNNMEELVAAGVIEGLPEDPFGGRFFIDSDGVIKNTTVLDEQLGRLKMRLNNAIGAYHKHFGEHPPSLHELVEHNYIGQLPVHPYASSEWVYDPATGTLQ